jgi:hypothetical protein
VCVRECVWLSVCICMFVCVCLSLFLCECVCECVYAFVSVFERAFFCVNEFV